MHSRNSYRIERLCSALEFPRTMHSQKHWQHYQVFTKNSRRGERERESLPPSHLFLWAHSSFPIKRGEERGGKRQKAEGNGARSRRRSAIEVRELNKSCEKGANIDSRRQRTINDMPSSLSGRSSDEKARVK